MAINTINWTDKVTFTGGEAQQFVLNDTWSNYFNPTTADVDFTTITADGSLSYRIYDTFVGEMQAKNWDSSVWTDLTADFSVSKLGKDDTQPQFVYIREWDGEGTEPDNYAISIYQVFVDSYNPDSITEDLGEYDVNGNGWSKTNAQVSVASATDAIAAMNSGIQTVTPNGTDYIYYVSIDDGANWIELAQDGSNIPEIGDTGHGSNGNVWVKAIDKAGNAYEKHVDALYIDTVQATISDIVANGTVGEDGWIKAGSDVTFEFLAKDYEGSGVDIVSIATWDAEN
jgi:hypothetical protein